MVYAVVVYGVVEPNVCVALDTVVYPRHVFLVYHVYYRISCPHDVGLLVCLFAEDVEVVAAGPALVVLCGAEYKGSNVVVSPVMEKLIEAYKAVNTGAEIELQTSDSTTGMTGAADGTLDIGMASRELKDSEVEAGLTATKIAMDGIAVVVNQENPVEDLPAETVKGIFMGEITEWGAAN